MREAGAGPPPAPPPLEPAVDGGLFIDVAPRAVLGLHKIRDEIDSALFTDGADGASRFRIEPKCIDCR